MPQPYLALTGVSKSFVPGVPVLENITLGFQRGEIHAILGENGAGKSTLLNIVYGMAQPDEGGLLLNGREVRHRSPADAIGNHIGMVHQHFQLVQSFTVAENLRLAAPPAIRREWRRDADIAQLAVRFGLGVEPRAIISSMPLAMQQRVEILKALVNKAELILLDEPTTILNPSEIEALYAVLGQIAQEGRAVVVVTHHLNEVVRYAQHASVIRRGRLISSGPVAGRARDDFVAEMVGHRVDLSTPLAKAGGVPGEVELSLERVNVAAAPSSSGLCNATLQVRVGEVVGIAGVEGNGQRELFEVIAGLRRQDSGLVSARRLHADGRPAIGLVPEDRHGEGLVLDLPISMNLLLNKIGEAPYSHAGRLLHASITAQAERMRVDSDIRARSVLATPRTLSGGNQQKIVLARAMNEEAQAVMVYQPTRGLDVAASEEVLRRLRAAANAGKAVLFISSNLDEIMRISDRVIVLYAGQVAGEVPGDAPREAVGALMTGGAHS